MKNTIHEGIVVYSLVSSSIVMFSSTVGGAAGGNGSATTSSCFEKRNSFDWRGEVRKKKLWCVRKAVLRLLRWLLCLMQCFLLHTLIFFKKLTLFNNNYYNRIKNQNWNLITKWSLSLRVSLGFVGSDWI